MNFQPWFINDVLTTVNYYDFLLRIVCAAICGAFIGLERERRLKNAGLRTHIIVAIASCCMMIVSKHGFMDVVTLTELKISVDASRIASNVVVAIGFLGAGVIFVKRENTVGVTTAAGLWATVGIGMSIGTGMYIIGIFTTVFILVIQDVLHKYHSKSHSQNSGLVRCNITKHNISISDLKKELDGFGFEIRDLSMTKNGHDETIITANMLFSQNEEIVEIMEALQKSDIIDGAEIFPIF